MRDTFNTSVPILRTINGHPLVGDIVLTMADFLNDSGIIAMGEAVLKWGDIEKGATSGANWATNLIGIPVNLAALGDVPGYITATKITSTTIESPIMASNWSLTGTLIASSGTTNTAGLTGETSGDDAIRFWAGDTYANRATAPFRVTQGGAVVAANISLKTVGSTKYIDIGTSVANEMQFFEGSVSIIRIGSEALGSLTPPGIKVNNGLIVSSTTLPHPAIYGMATAVSGVAKGVEGVAQGASGINYAFYATASGSSGGNYSFYGVKGDIYNAGSINIASGQTYQINGTNLIGTEATQAAAGNHTHDYSGTYAALANGAAFSAYGAIAYYVAPTSGGSPTVQLNKIVGTINSEARILLCAPD